MNFIKIYMASLLSLYTSREQLSSKPYKDLGVYGADGGSYGGGGGGSRTRLAHRTKDDLGVVRNEACLPSSAYAYSSLGGSQASV